jgi:hypothetical protein
VVCRDQVKREFLNVPGHLAQLGVSRSNLDRLEFMPIPVEQGEIDRPQGLRVVLPVIRGIERTLPANCSFPLVMQPGGEDEHLRVSLGQVQPLRQFYRLTSLPPGEHDDLVRLALWSRNRQDEPQAVVSHESALVLHDLSELLPAEIHLTVPPTFRKEPPAGCVLHRGRLAPKDIEERAGFQVTVPLRSATSAAGTWFILAAVLRVMECLPAQEARGYCRNYRTALSG